MDWTIKPPEKGLRGEMVSPSDKSISHRAIMFGSIAEGVCRVRNFLKGHDCMSTLGAFRAMGVEIDMRGDTVTVRGRGLRGLARPEKPLYVGNSGTTMRIISGILAGQSFDSELTGDESLSGRPMRRVVEPLSFMGSDIRTMNGEYPPVRIAGSEGPLKAIDYRTPVASAQVKSCVLSAGLYASGTTSVTEPFQSRDHTERVLEHFSADIIRQGLTTTIKGQKALRARDIDVPGDISSAAFFIVAALLVEGSDIIIRNVGLNPTRDGLIRVLKRMGADIEVLDLRGEMEPAGDLRVRTSELRGTVIRSGEIPLLIDEVPVIMIAALTASGPTEIRGIKELKVKETDRVSTMARNISRLSDAPVTEKEGSLFIQGGAGLLDGRKEFNSYGDHRVAMSMAVASLLGREECVIRDVECCDTSYPDFLRDLEGLIS
jgi:3-phosphoshikimate 1-carboxyvinyltransferase